MEEMKKCVLHAVMVLGVGFVQGWWLSLLKCCWSSITVCGNLGRASVSAAGHATAIAAVKATAKADAYAKQDREKPSKRWAAERLDAESEEAHPSAKPQKGEAICIKV